MNWLQKVYWWLWFHIEFNRTPVDRRPFTFIMRDYFNLHPVPAWTMTAIWFAGMFVFNLFHPVPASIIGYFSAFVLAHVIWGAPWIEGQQENPQYLGESWDGKEWIEVKED